MKERVLVTGWSGFIGSHVLEAFEADDRYSMKRFSGDIRDEANVVRNMRDIDAVIHLASFTYVPPSWSNPSSYYEVNTLGTLNILKAHDMWKRLYHFSTSHVYGNQERMPITEDSQPRPADPYAASKFAAENLVRLYTERYALHTMVIRPFNNFGPRQQRQLFVPTIIRQYLENGRVTIHGDTEREFVYVKDTAHVVKALVDEDAKGLVHICQGIPYRLSDIARLLTPNIVVLDSERENWDIKILHGDNSRLKRLLPSLRFTPMQEAMAETVGWHREH